MNRLFIVLIALFCGVGLLLNQGYAAGLHSCCHEHKAVKEVAAHSGSGGDCHAGKAQLAQQPKESKKQSSDCHCHPASPPLADSNIKAFTPPSDLHGLVTVLHPNPTQALQIADNQMPIWLYWHFYPDRSKSYLENRHLLL